VHRKYVDTLFPDLVKAAVPMEDAVELHGERIYVENAWRVHKKS
jgi:hypothetical protein